MKFLAEFVMRGRFQALLVSVAAAGSVLFCWISAAVLALVTLRKGPGPGAGLLAWAILPAGAVLLAFGDSGPLTLLVGTTVMAVVLRLTVSLPMAVLAAIPVALATALALLAFGGRYLDQVVPAFAELMNALEQQLSRGGEAVSLPRPDAAQVAGFLGVGTAVGSVLCLLLARYWQAALYNPGGFGREFRALHYTPAVALLLVAVAGGLLAMGVQYSFWAAGFALPLELAGLALVHAWVAARGRGRRGWLVGFYLAWVILDPVKLLVLLAAVVDSWANFRRRWTGGPGAGNSDNRSDEDR